MRTLMTVRCAKAVLGVWVILVLVTVTDLHPANGQDALTLEGEWAVTSSWTKSEVGGRFTIVRKGGGYDLLFSPRSVTKGELSPNITYYGTPNQIIATHTPSFDELVSNFHAESDGALRSALRQMAGKFTQRRRVTLSADGRSAELVTDKLRVLYDTNGRLIDHKIGLYENITTLGRVSGPAPATKTVTSAIGEVEARGEYYFLTKDGRKLTGKEANQVPLEEGTRMVTGSSGRIKMKLPDETTFTVGPNSDMVIDKFVYDPDNTPRTIMANMSKGVFRWVTGKMAQKDPAQMKVKIPIGTIGIRGTDFETTVNHDGTGHAMLYFGQLEITEKKSGFTFVLNPGEKVMFGPDGSISRPMKFE